MALKLFNRDKEKDTVQQPQQQPQEPQKYVADPTWSPKDRFMYYKDKVLKDERFQKADDETKKKYLDNFFNKYGSEYLKTSGIEDPNKMSTFKERWVNETFNSQKSVAPKKKDLPDSSEDLVLPDWIKRGAYDYTEAVSKADNLKIETTRTPEVEKEIQSHKEEIRKKFPEITSKLLSNPDFGYVKSNPSYFIERGDESVKEVDKYLKKNTDLQYSDRQDYIDYLTRDANQSFISNLKEKYPGNLDADVETAAKPFTEGDKGTFLDPKTDKRVNMPETDDQADYLSLKSKNGKELIQEVLAASTQSPLYDEKRKLDDEYSSLQESSNSLKDILSQTEELNKSAKTLSKDEYLKKYTELTSRYDKEYKSYMKSLDSYNEKVNEFNQKINDLPSEDTQPVKQRLKEALDNAYLEYKHWDERFNQAQESIQNKGEYLGTASRSTLEDINKKRHNARAKFEAASRMYYNQEGPESVQKDAKYMADVFGSSLVKALGGGKTGEELSYYEPTTKQEVLKAMGTVGTEANIQFSDQEKEALRPSILENVVAGTGSLMPSMVELMLLGQASNIIKGATGLDKLKNGYQIIKNPVLKEARVVGLSDAVPTGWKAVKTFKPTAWQKAYASIGEAVMDEALFAGVGNFQLGAITGMNNAHLIMPDIKLKGKLQMFNPIFDMLYKSGIGATAGMESGAIVSGMVNDALKQRPFGSFVDESFPDVNETSKRVAEEFMVNTLMFGGMGLFSKGISKQNSAPMGAKFNRFGEANWTAYFSPDMRNKVYKAAREFEAKGYPDAAKEMYNWLDVTKDPVTAEQMKQVRIGNLKGMYQGMDIGTLRELKDLHEGAIKALESQGRKPEFDGKVTLPIRTYDDVKLNSVVKAGDNYYEVVSKENASNGTPVKFETIDINSGEPRTFSLKDGKFEFEPSVKYTLGHPLEIPQRLEAHYEVVGVLNDIIADKGRYGKNFKLKGVKEEPSQENKKVPEKVPETTKKEQPVKVDYASSEKMSEVINKAFEGNLKPVEVPKESTPEETANIEDVNKKYEAIQQVANELTDTQKEDALKHISDNNLDLTQSIDYLNSIGKEQAKEPKPETKPEVKPVEEPKITPVSEPAPKETPQEKITFTFHDGVERTGTVVSRSGNKIKVKSGGTLYTVTDKMISQPVTLGERKPATKAMKRILKTGDKNVFTQPIQKEDQDFGEVTIEQKPAGWEIKRIDINEPGKGYGKKIYRQLNDQAGEAGTVLKSDVPDKINDNAKRVWESFVKSGEAVKNEDGSYQMLPSEKTYGEAVKNISELSDEVAISQGEVTASGESGTLSPEQKISSVSDNLVKNVIQSGTKEFTGLIDKLLNESDQAQLEKSLPFIKKSFSNISEDAAQKEAADNFTEEDLKVRANEIGEKPSESVLDLQAKIIKTEPIGIDLTGSQAVETVEVNSVSSPYSRKEVESKVSAVGENYTSKIKSDIDSGLKTSLSQNIRAINKEYSAKRKELSKKITTDGGTPEEYNKAKEVLDKNEAYRIAVERGKAEATKKELKKYTDFFSPGKVLYVPMSQSDQLGSVRMPEGVFLGFNVTEPTNISPETIELKFAVSDGRKEVTLKVSDKDKLDKIISLSSSITNKKASKILDKWDKNLSKKQTRYILKNIPEDSDEFPQGKRIKYTDSNGDTQTGILMPENWLIPDSRVADIPANEMHDIITSSVSGDFIESSDGEVLIRKQPFYTPQRYEIRVPKKKTIGAKYYDNETLKGLVEFESKNDRYVGIFPEDKLQDVLDALNDIGVTMQPGSRSVQVSMSQTDAETTINKYGKEEKGTKDRNGLSNPYNDTVGTEYVGEGDRIAPDPITGEKPKKLWEIQANLSESIGKKIRYSKRPSDRGKAIGAYYPGTGKTVIKMQGDLNTTAHEIGHFIDDKFGLLGPEADQIRDKLKPELSKLWDYGSKPPKGHPNPEAYQMMEGMAEFIRAWVVNPKSAKDNFPETYKWFMERVSKNKKTLDALENFSHDVRVWFGSSYGDQILSNLNLDWNNEKEPLAFSRENREGQYQVTAFDKLARRITYIYQPLDEAYKWAMKKQGVTNIEDPTQLSPLKNAVYLIRNHLGLEVKLQNMLEKGLTDFNLNRIIDDVTQQPVSIQWIIEAVPTHDYHDIKENLGEAFKYGAAQRIIEIPWKLQARQIREDLKTDANKLPPLDILEQHPFIQEQFGEKINSILDKLDNEELTPEDVFLPKERYDFTKEVISGVAQEGMTDYKIAKGAIDEFENLKKENPAKHKWVTEFLRRYRKVGDWYMDYAVESGMLDPEVGKMIKEEGTHYIMFRRAFSLDPQGMLKGEDSEWGGPTQQTKGKGLQPKLQIHAVKGSDKPIQNPLAEMIGAIMRLVDAGDTNYALMSVAEAFTSKREVYEGTPVNTGELMWISSQQEPRSIQFFYKGSKRWLVVRNKEIYETLTDLVPATTTGLMKYLTFLPRLLRATIVSAPQFVLRNVPRDFISWLQLGASHRYSRPRDIIYNKEWDDLFELAGGGQFGFINRSRKGYYEVMKQAMFKASKDPNKYIMNPKKTAALVGDKLFGWIEKSERPTRRVQFRAAYKEGIKKYKLSPLEATMRAAFLARDLMDFAVAGTWVKEINRFIPFTGAQIRGLEKTFRQFKKHPGKTAALVTLVTILPSVLNSMLLAMLASDDKKEEYINMPPYYRDLFFMIPIGDRWFMIPKGFELAALSSIFQRGADKVLLDDKRAYGKEWRNNFYNMFNPYTLSGIAGGYAGVIATLFNYDFFRQKNVIPPDEKDIAIVLRNTERASKFGKLVQKASDWVTPGTSNNPKIDARMVDAFIKGQFTYYGQYFLDFMDAALPGQSQEQYKIDLALTGLVKNSPVYNAPNVQWMLNTYKEFPWLKNETPYLDELNQMFRVYFSDEVQADRKKMDEYGQVIREYASQKRDMLEQIPMYDVSAAMKKLKEMKRK